MVGTRNLRNEFSGEEDAAEEGAGDQTDNNSLESDYAVVKGVSFFSKLSNYNDKTLFELLNGFNLECV